MKGRLHLIEKLDHVFPLKDGSGLFASGYWELTEEERTSAKELMLHRTKAKRSHFGGQIEGFRPATDFRERAIAHNTDPEGRWVILVRPALACKEVPWEGATHAMAYKSLV